MVGAGIVVITTKDMACRPMSLFIEIGIKTATVIQTEKWFQRALFKQV